MKWQNKGHEFDEIGNIFKQNKDLLLLGDIDKALKMKECLSFLNADISIPTKDAMDSLEIDVSGKTILIFGDYPNIEEFLISKNLKMDVNYFVIYNFYSKYFYNYESNFIMKYLSIFALYAYDKVYISSNNIITTTVCNLNCKSCLNFNPFIKNKRHNEFERLKNDIDLYFKNVDMVGLMHITGGEPSLYPDIIKLLMYINKNYRHKIIDLVMPTNGIREISDELLESINSANMTIQVDNYLEAVPEFEKIYIKNLEKIEKYNIKADIIPAGKFWNWAQAYPPRYDYSKLDNDEMIKRYDYCGSMFSEIRNGTISGCCYHSFAETAGILDYDEDSLFDLKGNVNKKELIEFRLKYCKKGYTEFCKICNGLNPLNRKVVKPAEQTKGILSWDGNFTEKDYIPVDILKIPDFSVKITVITPTYNRADFLPKTIESILNQTYTNFEYYILDDGSTDNTKEVVKPYLKDNRVKYLYHENSGEPETVNWGWSLAKGEYFTQINSDDIVDKRLFEEMIKVLDNDDNAVVAYCDYNIINDKNKRIKSIKSPDWNFLEALSNFSCYAAMVGTFIKRTKFLDWNYIRTDKYLHINDLEMYWNMALYGNFIHIPKNLVSWRKHKGQISVNRVDSIYEIADWFKEYFNKPNISNDVLKIKNTVANNILRYAGYLLEPSNFTKTIKDKIKRYLKRELGLIKFTCLQIGDNDLIGNKFNGHNLGIYLRENKIESNHIVNRKESNDEYTYVYAPNNITERLIKNSLFLDSDILHFHLIHNTNFDIKYLPIITKFKPAVITLHDLYFLGGHCVYHFDCQKWKTHCHDCEYLDKPFAMKNDGTAFQFEIKKKFIQESNLSIIVASKWVEDKVKESPIWKGKKIYRVPFGIDQNIFKPININDAKKELNISENSITLMFRADKNIYKGLDIIKYTLNKIKSKNKITLITVSKKGLLKEFKNNFNILEYGWIEDDSMLAKLYQACDIFLMPSKEEAFGMMAIEAMSCGKMVIALEGTALTDVINAPECGIVCKENEYADKLQYFINNLDEAKRRGELSLKFAKENYNKNLYVNRIIDVYNNVIKEHKVDIEYQPILEQLNKYYNTINVNDESDDDKKVKKDFTFGIYISNDEKYFIIGILGIKITIKKKKVEK
ncbi:glycosyltransferase [Brachyspira hampsonii]|uniref:glycosyltransferase n=1 Tax=Brachyspira hampsonii TaxID=1287055 RepID=UPI000D339DED|nr:glycosyltransferase [Brachyspira hampsonii]PTY40497.1 hypothetical protein DQ06_07935 [Brachyspira hampsonii bv. II]